MSYKCCNCGREFEELGKEGLWLATQKAICKICYLLYDDELKLLEIKYKMRDREIYK